MDKAITTEPGSNVARGCEFDDIQNIMNNLVNDGSEQGKRAREYFMSMHQENMKYKEDQAAKRVRVVVLTEDKKVVELTESLKSGVDLYTASLFRGLKLFKIPEMKKDKVFMETTYKVLGLKGANIEMYIDQVLYLVNEKLRGFRHNSVRYIKEAFFDNVKEKKGTPFYLCK